MDFGYFPEYVRYMLRNDFTIQHMVTENDDEQSTYNDQCMREFWDDNRMETICDRWAELEDVRDGSDIFYEEQKDALKRDVKLKKKKHQEMHTMKPLPNDEDGNRTSENPRLPVELQCHVISLYSKTTELKTYRLVNREWNREVIFHTPLFSFLDFSDHHNINPSQSRHIEYSASLFLVLHGIEHNVTTITLRNWQLDTHCWYLHLLQQVHTVRIVDCQPWEWLYCIPSSVTKLVIRRTDIRVLPDLHRLAAHNSRLTSLTLDNSNISCTVHPYLDEKDETRQLWNAELGLWFDELDELEYDERLETDESRMSLASYNPIILKELSIYHDSDDITRKNGYKTIEELLYMLVGNGIIELSDNQLGTPSLRINGTTLTTLRCGFGGNTIPYIRPDTWENLDESLSDLTIKGEDYPEALLNIQNLSMLSILRVEINLDNDDGVSWPLNIARQWTCHRKTDFYIYVYEEHPWSSMDTRFCNLRIYDVQVDDWITCSSWHVWWSSLFDWLTSECFAASPLNGGTKFRGRLHIIFIMTKLTEPPRIIGKSSPVEYAKGLVTAFAKRYKLAVDLFTEVDVISYDCHRG